MPFFLQRRLDLLGKHADIGAQDAEVLGASSKISGFGMTALQMSVVDTYYSHLRTSS